MIEGEIILRDKGKIYDEAYGDGSKTPSDETYHMETKPMEHADEDDGESYDKLLGAEVMVDFGIKGTKRATMKSRARDYEGNLIGQYNKNPNLDQREDVLEYEDGTYDRMFANIIAANLFFQLDADGNAHILMKDIVDHRRDESTIAKEDGFIVLTYGVKIPKKTTRGWELVCVEWRDGGKLHGCN